jgi:hypothetical protein
MAIPTRHLFDRIVHEVFHNGRLINFVSKILITAETTASGTVGGEDFLIKNKRNQQPKLAFQMSVIASQK